MKIREQLKEMFQMQRTLNKSILDEFGEEVMTEEKLELAIIDELETVFAIGFDLRTKTMYAVFGDKPMNIDVPLLKNPLMKLVEQQKKELGWIE
nr:MAG TPA: hypothetical protein [Caudoviricetes sp.]